MSNYSQLLENDFLPIKILED